MLILHRKVTEFVVIDNLIHVAVLAINSENVTLGFIAPRSIEVYRSELYHKKIQDRIQQIDTSREYGQRKKLSSQ